MTIEEVVRKVLLDEHADVIREAVKAVCAQGEGCCVASPLDGVGFIDDVCRDDCCAVPPATGSASPTVQHGDSC
jgi:hypothetical protein